MCPDKLKLSYTVLNVFRDSQQDLHSSLEWVFMIPRFNPHR